MRMARSATQKLWDGVRMGGVLARPDPDAPGRRVVLPVSWQQDAADALALLAPMEREPDLARLAETWLARLDAGDPELAVRAQTLLLRQQAAPAEAAWSGEGPAGYLLNLEALDHLADAATLADWGLLACAAAIRIWPGTGRPRLALTGLAGLIAASGLDYDSVEARGGTARLLKELRDAVPRALLVVHRPGPVDALLGVEAAGIAPTFGPLDPAGGLSRTSLTYLAARGIRPKTAFASLLAGGDPLPVASPAAHAAMAAALRPLLDELPPLPRPMPADPRPARRQDLPGRRGGYAQKAMVGGQKVFLRTGEYTDGRLGEVTVSLPQASPAVRALVECLSQAIGIGLQHGAPLADFLDAMAGTRFGPSGAVDGDPAVARATSPLDYVARNLAHAYLPGAALPPAEPEGDDAAPLLPLDLSPPQPPPAARRRGLRVVK
jgi:ribonucleoside-diphosphate reductase alpha chain